MKVLRIFIVAVFLLSVLTWGIGKFHVMHQDNTPPVIHSDSSEIHVSTKAGEVELKKGLTATDDVNGDITDNILIANLSHFFEKGVCKIEYLVFDESNNAGHYERTVRFDDYESPKISLDAPLMYIQNKEIILSDRLHVTDCLEGDISGKMRFSSAGATSYEAGVYELYVEARNSYGDFVKETLLLNVIPYENNRGTIELEEYLIYVHVGEEISPEKYLKDVMDNEGNDIPLESVIITKEVDTSKPGTGQFRYEIRDKNGSVAASTFLAIIVTE